MSIKKLKKITLYGLADEKKAVLSGLQKLGCLHLIPLNEKEAVFRSEVSAADETKEALAYLQSCPNKRRIVRNTNEPIKNLVSLVLENKRELREISDERDELIKRINTVRPWGDFKLSSLEDRNDVHVWFYTIPKSDVDVMQTLDYPYEIVHQDNKFCYVVVLAQREPDQEKMPVKRSHIGKSSLSELEVLKENAEYRLDENQLERERLTRWIYVIGQAVARIEDGKSLRDACSVVLSADQMFLVSGWMPVDQEKAVKTFVEKHELAAVIETPKRDEIPPSLISHAEKTGGGSDTMLFFTTPAYRAWDPGSVLFFSFALFFGMIMNDAMYSIIFGLVIALYHKKMGKSETGRRLRTMFYFMSVVGFFWGVLAGSYFGVEPEEGSFLASLHVINMSDYADMMKLSVVIGALHIVIANAVVAWNNRKSGHSLANIGWCGLIIGATTLWLGYTGDLPIVWQKSIGPVLMLTGAVLILFFESHRPVDGVKNILLRLKDGVSALWHITGAFGDILSYMRLFALGLAGASLAITFNSMAMQVLHSLPGVGIFFCILILLAGHALNLLLSLMAAFVHGIRLNVIEFLKWALSGEGYPFKPFKKLEESN